MLARALAFAVGAITFMRDYAIIVLVLYGSVYDRILQAWQNVNGAVLVLVNVDCLPKFFFLGTSTSIYIATYIGLST